MKLRLLLAFLVTTTTVWQGISQTTTTIGAGAAISATNENGNPIYRSSSTSTFDFSQSIQLYTQSDLNQAGIYNGATISSIAFNKTSAFGITPGATASLVVNMRNSGNITLGTVDTFAALTAGSTVVYSNPAVTDATISATPGFVTLTLATPFVYTGGSLEIGLDWDISTPTTPTTGTFQWAYDVSSNIQARGFSASSAITGNLTGPQSRRYQLQATFTGGTACTSPPVGGQTVANFPAACDGLPVALTVTGATLGAGSSVQWQFSTDNVTFNNIAGATLPSYSFTYSAATAGFYQRVQTCTGQTGTSTPVQVSAFIAATNQVETFDNYLPSCWTEAAGLLVPSVVFSSTTTSNWTSDGFLNNGTTGSARIEIWTTSTDEWLISPTYNLTGNEQLVFDLGLTFWSTTAPAATTGVDDKFAVIISTDNGATWSDANTLRLWDNAGSPNVYNNISNTGETVILDLSSYTGNVKFGFYGESTVSNADNNVYVDNLQVRTIPNCLDVTSTTFVSATPTTADFTWESNNPNTSGRFEYLVDSMNSYPTGPDSSVMATGMFPIGNSNATTPIAQAGQVTGLAAATTYDLYIREVCTASDSSPWTSAVSFTTACIPVSAFSENFDAVTTPFLPVCWSSFVTTPVGTTAAVVQTNTAADNSPANGIRMYSGSLTGNIGSGTSDEGENILISPILSNLSAGTHRLKFFADAGTTTSTIEVGTITDPTDPSTFTALGTFAPTTTHAEYIQNFDTYTGTDQYIALRHIFDGTFDTMYVDDIVWEAIPPCLMPQNLAVTSFTTTTIDLSWTNPNTSMVSSVEYGAVGFTPGAGTTVAGLGSTATITGLMPGTMYDFYVTQDCSASADGLSTTAGPISGTTACLPVTAFSENFDGVSTPDLPLCWSAIVIENIAGTDPAVGTSTAADNSVPNGARLYNGSGDIATTVNDALLVSPLLSNLGAGTHRLRFFGDASPVGTVEIGTLANPTDPSTFTLLETVTLTTTHTEYIVNFASYTGTDTYIAFRHPNLTTVDNIYLDDIVWEANPACIEPMMLSVSSFSDTVVNLSWTNSNSSNVSSIEYGPVGFTPGAGTTVAGLGNTASITGLTAETAYDFYVTQDCSATGNGLSVVAGPVSATTACAVLAAPYFVDFENFTAATSGFETDQCWNEVSPTDYDWAIDNSGGTGSSNTGPSGAFSGSTFMFVEASNGAPGDVATVVSPLVNLSALSVPALSFYYHMYGSQITSLEVSVSTNSGATFTNVLTITGQQQAADTDPWLQSIIDLSAYANQTVIVSFTTTKGTGTLDFEGDVAIDDVRFDELPNCVQPSMLNATAITATSAQLGWTTGGSGETAWDVEIVAAGTAPTGTPTFSGVSNPYNAMALTPDTAYDFYVRAACSATDFSPYSGPFNFRTLCTPVTMFPVTTDFTNNVPNACWSEAGDGEFAAGPSGFGASDWNDGRAYTNAAGTVVNSNRINLWQNVDREWLISETYDLGTGSYNLAVEVAVTDYSFSGTSTAADTDTMGSDDSVILAITTDNGVTWTALTTWNVGNQPAVTGTEFITSLSSYSGLVQFAFLASDGTIDDLGVDYDFHVGSFRIETTAGTSDTALAASLSLYPNPVNGDELNIAFDQSTQETVNVTIVNMTGQVIRTERFDQVSNTVTLNNMTRLATGVYFVNVTQGTQSATLKFIKQ